MTDEDKKMEEKEEIWLSVDELLTEQNKTHFATSRYRKKLIKFGWKELSDEEMEANPISTIDDKGTEKERTKRSEDWLMNDFLARVKKAGEMDGCTNKNILDEKLWKSLPKRVKNELYADVMGLKNSLSRDFQ